MAAGARCGRVDVCAMGRRGGHLHARETTKDGRVLQGASLRTRARPPLATDIWGYARTRRPPPPKSTDAASPEIEIEIEIESESTDAASPPAVMPRRVTLTTTRRTLTTAHTPLTTALRPLTTAPHRSRRRVARSRCGHSLDELIKLARAVGDTKRKAGQICRLGVLVPLRLVKGLFEVLVGFSVLALCLREAAEL